MYNIHHIDADANFATTNLAQSIQLVLLMQFNPKLWTPLTKQTGKEDVRHDRNEMRPVPILSECIRARKLQPKTKCGRVCTCREVILHSFCLIVSCVLAVLASGFYPLPSAKGLFFLFDSSRPRFLGQFAFAFL